MAAHKSVDALIAEVEAAQAAPKTMESPDGASAMPPGWEDLAMQVFLFLLGWWKSRSK